MTKGLIFNIQAFSIHDGPGLRSIVFFKGCPLHCKWCSNPEGINRHQDIAFKKTKCIGISKCGACLNSCSKNAITVTENYPAIDRNKCNNCGICAQDCPAKALELFGREMSVSEVISEVEKDDAFYSRSGGGITLSGGEPLLQADFAQELLQQAHRSGMETAIETTCFVQWENIAKVFPYLDYIHIDLKSADREKHQQFTGVDPVLIWENFAKVCNTFSAKPIVVRTPLIPGFNDSVEEIQKIVDKIETLGKNAANIRYELLPYHAFGAMKYEYLGQTYPMGLVSNMDKSVAEDIKKQLKTSITLV